MKKNVLICVMCLMALTMHAQVDLGLPSGTLWSYSKVYDYYTYDEAVSKYGKRLPTVNQWNELKNQCTWTWEGNGYKVTGPNGNSIHLSINGYINCSDGEMTNKYCGYYWAFSSQNSDYAWTIVFSSKIVATTSSNKCEKQSVHLVED